MLKAKPPAPGDIVSIKLTTGDELIAQLVTSDTTSYTLHRPVLMEVGMTDDAQVGIDFMPFILSAEDDAIIALLHSATLARAVKTRSNIAADYRHAVRDPDPAENDTSATISGNANGSVRLDNVTLFKPHRPQP